MEAVLFSKCAGFTDARAIGTQKANPRTGSTELIDCLNLTITDDGRLEKIPALVTALTHSAPITNISAGQRFIYQDGIDTKEWSGTQVATIGAILDGTVAHTPIDCRISGNSAVYKSAVSGVAVQQAMLGDTSAIPPTGKPFYAMPPFSRAFVHNAKLYSVSAEDNRFVQYSEDYHYDVYALGDNHIGSALPVLQSGAIPNVLLTAHAEGVTAYIGSGPHDFVKRFFPCNFIDGTLYSGAISQKQGQQYDGSQTVPVTHLHIFLCDNGLYTVDQNGNLLNLTAGQVDRVSLLNGSYSCATVTNGKYMAFGNTVTLEYDFYTKTMLKRSPFGIVSACNWKGTAYFATGSTVVTQGTEIGATADFSCGLTLPFSDMGQTGKKSISRFYFTGQLDGDATITATDQEGNYWEVEVSDLGTVQNYGIKTPKGMLGNHISVKIEVASGSFRIEELRAALTASQRSR